MRKKFLAVISAITITTLAFTGCGSSGSGESSSSDDSASGTTGAITVISREDGSGTRGAFVELLGIMDEEENDITVSTAEITNSTSVMLQTVAQNEKAIGYVSLGSLSDDVKAIQVDGVDATTDNVKSGTYKVSRPFEICYQEDNLTDLDRDFISFIMSEEGQSIISEDGYIPVETQGTYTASGQEGKISISGSTSVAPVMEKLAEEYKSLNPDVTIDIQQPGSGAGIQAAIEGTVEIGMSSRALEEEELATLTEQQIALDGIAVIVNKNNDISNLTSEQIKNIYVGDTTNWEDVQ